MKYKNRQTENVLYWIKSTPGILRSASRFMYEHPDASRPYKEFISHEGMEFMTTPDGVYWNWSQLDFKLLNEFMRSFLYVKPIFMDDSTATDGLPT